MEIESHNIIAVLTGETLFWFEVFMIVCFSISDATSFLETR